MPEQSNECLKGDPSADVVVGLREVPVVAESLTRLHEVFDGLLEVGGEDGEDLLEARVGMSEEVAVGAWG